MQSNTRSQAIASIFSWHCIGTDAKRQYPVAYIVKTLSTRQGNRLVHKNRLCAIVDTLGN